MLILGQSTVVKAPWSEEANFNGNVMKEFHVGFKGDNFGFILGNAYGYNTRIIEDLKIGDRIHITVNGIKLNEGKDGKKSYISGTVLEATPMTITDSRYYTEEDVIQDTAVVHDNIPVAERKTTRNGKPRLNPDYAKAAAKKEQEYVPVYDDEPVTATASDDSPPWD